MQSSEPGLPEGWTGPRAGVRDHLATAGTLAIAAVSVLAGVAAARAGNAGATKYCLLFALAMALAAALGATIRYRRTGLAAAVRTVERGGESTTEIHYSTSQFALLIALTGCCTIFCVVASVEIFVRQGQGGPLGASVLLGTVGLFFASFGTTVALGRIRRGRITLSERGIAQRGWSFESRLEWPAIAGVKPAFNGHPVILVIGYGNANWDRRYTTRVWRIDRLPPVPMIEVDCRKFDVDPFTLYTYMRTYVSTPAARSELGTEVALTRARQVYFAG